MHKNRTSLKLSLHIFIKLRITLVDLRIGRIVKNLEPSDSQKARVMVKFVSKGSKNEINKQKKKNVY